MDPRTRERIEANLFPFARHAVEPWEAFPWHIRSRQCDTWQTNSSQALAIDVFGSLKCAETADRDAICDALARNLGLPEGGPWAVELEWSDPHNRMRETGQKTQVDAIARSPKALVFFECKFTEKDGGQCSQPAPLAEGAHQGQRQCNGRYGHQTNPVTGRTGRCALTAKGIRYWDAIPTLFRHRSDQDHTPCPFAGSWYQWMRNLAVCWEVARTSTPALAAGFCVVYADSEGLPFAQKIRSPEWTRFVEALRPEAVRFGTMPYQGLIGQWIRSISEAGRVPGLWNELLAWVRRKIEEVAGPAVG